MQFTRYLKFTIPLMKGEDVLWLQQGLVRSGNHQVGEPDGKFGAATDRAVRSYQRSQGLSADGIIGPSTWNSLFNNNEDTRQALLNSYLKDLKKYHAYRDSVQWRLQKNGVEIENAGVPVTGGQPATVRRVWQQFGAFIDRWSMEFQVPAELIVATICTESKGNPNAVREEPGYVSDSATPHLVSPGLMQTLISTARGVLRDPNINRAWLLQPSNSIKAGTAYIALQSRHTHYDAPKVACAYNAGGVYYNGGANNRWRMRQFPIGTSHHADRYVEWHNDFYRFLKSDGIRPRLSFHNDL